MGPGEKPDGWRLMLSQGRCWETAEVAGVTANQSSVWSVESGKEVTFDFGVSLFF